MSGTNRFCALVMVYLHYSSITAAKRKRVNYMSLEEQKEVAINRYVDLMRIKAHETGENKELDYQIKIAKVKLSSFGIDYSELEF